MSSVTKFKEPAEKKVLKGDLPERIRRVQKACEMIQQSYIYNLTIDKHAIAVGLYTSQFPEHTHRECISMQRVKLQPEQFELDENLTIDKDFKVKEALAYKLHTRCMDPQNPETDILAYSIERIGHYWRPFGSIQRDRLGNPISSKVAFWRNMYWIPFTEENVRKVLDEFNGVYTKPPILCIANREGDKEYSASYTVPNLDEWIHGSFNDLLAANKSGTLSSEYGGYSYYLKDKAEKKKKLEADIKGYDLLENREKKTR
jgi:hypothetical protein